MIHRRTDHRRPPASVASEECHAKTKIATKEKKRPQGFRFHLTGPTISGWVGERSDENPPLPTKWWVFRRCAPQPYVYPSFFGKYYSDTGSIVRFCWAQVGSWVLVRTGACEW